MKDYPDLCFTQEDKPYVFRDLEAFSPHISRLVFMLDYARRNTLASVQGLSAEQLDTQVMKQGNTIGMLLTHIAQVEETYQSVTFRGVRPTGRVARNVLSDAGRKKIKKNELSHYLEYLKAVRAETLMELQKRDDDWLHQEHTPWPNKVPMNNSFCWFHVLEDELNHGGQIKILRKEIELSAIQQLSPFVLNSSPTQHILTNITAQKRRRVQV